jgi:hypothetical protein
MKKKRRKKNKRQKVNLILTHIKHTFLILDFGNGPHAFRHINTLRKSVFLM